MLSQLFRLATLAKGAVALSLVTGAYGAATTNLVDQRPIVASAHMDFTNQVTPTPKPISRRETREGTTQTEDTSPAVEALVRECVTKYARIASFKDAPSAEREDAGRLVKEVCERAMKASGLDADAFWAKYRSLFHPAKNGEETKRPETSTKSEPDASFEGLLKECTTGYMRLVSSKEMPAAEREEAGRPVREVCERAMKASGLEAGAFWAKYRSQFGTTKNEETKRPDANKSEAASSFEGLLKECATKYLRLVSSKEMPAAEREEAGRLVREVCERAIKASGLEAGAFWAKYHTLFAHSTTKSEETKKPETTTKGEAAPSFEALFKECITKYARATSLREATTVEREEAGRLAKDACERAIRASGLETGAFWAKYGRYMTPTAKLEPTTSPKPAASPKPVGTDPLVRECYAKYQELATLRSGAVEAYEAAVRTFNENCRRVLEASHN